VQEIQARIDAIKKLRESQQGPSAVLHEIKARFDAVPGLYLKSIEQKDNEVTIKGESPNEYSVTKFGQSLEFSNGLFSNLNIETQREVSKGMTMVQPSASSGSTNVETVKPEIVSFTVKASFGASKIQAPPTAAPANQVAMKK
jgi:Tfp pilus assembly protein PilN